MDAKDLHLSAELGLSCDRLLTLLQLGMGLLGFDFLTLHLELLTLVVFLPEVLLLPPHFLVILLLELQLVLDVFNIAVNGLERF